MRKCLVLALLALLADSRPAMALLGPQSLVSVSCNPNTKKSPYLVARFRDKDGATRDRETHTIRQGRDGLEILMEKAADYDGFGPADLKSALEIQILEAGRIVNTTPVPIPVGKWGHTGCGNLLTDGYTVTWGTLGQLKFDWTAAPFQAGLHTGSTFTFTDSPWNLDFRGFGSGPGKAYVKLRIKSRHKVSRYLELDNGGISTSLTSLWWARNTQGIIPAPPAPVLRLASITSSFSPYGSPGACQVDCTIYAPCPSSTEPPGLQILSCNDESPWIISEVYYVFDFKGNVEVIRDWR